MTLTSHPSAKTPRDKVEALSRSRINTEGPRRVARSGQEQALEQAEPGNGEGRTKVNFMEARPERQ
jgi:hypothetical protein